MGWDISDSAKLEEAIFELKLRIAQKIGVQAGMTVVDMGCGQGGFTAALANSVGENGKVLAVDVSDEYLAEFNERLSRYGVKDVVTFVQKDAANIKDVISDGIADIVASYRLLEELKQPSNMANIVREMARIVKREGKVAVTELSTNTRNEVEETYIRLHKESGDSLFKPSEIVKAMKQAKLVDIRIEEVETNIWFSPTLAKQDLGFAQVWFDAEVEKTLGPVIEKYGMKYPSLMVITGMENPCGHRTHLGFSVENRKILSYKSQQVIIDGLQE
jgi:ubiquinone/menaquinone biosynthesis C-methylase UbiE